MGSQYVGLLCSRHINVSQSRWSLEGSWNCSIIICIIYTTWPGLCYLLLYSATLRLPQVAHGAIFQLYCSRRTDYFLYSIAKTSVNWLQYAPIFSTLNVSSYCLYNVPCL